MHLGRVRLFIRGASCHFRESSCAGATYIRNRNTNKEEVPEWLKQAGFFYGGMVQ